jgi:hypothetical protein
MSTAGVTLACNQSQILFGTGFREVVLLRRLLLPFLKSFVHILCHLPFLCDVIQSQYLSIDLSRKILGKYHFQNFPAAMDSANSKTKSFLNNYVLYTILHV